MNQLHETFYPFLNLADAVIITDRDHQVISVNPSYEKITGYSLNEIMDRNANVVRSELTPREVYAEMKTALTTGLAWRGVFTNRRKNGSLWHASMTITPYTVEEVIYYVGVFRELEQLSRGYYLTEERIGQFQSSILKVLALSCEIRDPNIEQHLTRVRDFTERLAKHHNQRLMLGWSEEQINEIAYSSILHDIGKSGVPEGILYKPGKLAYYERQIIELHCSIGNDIIQRIYAEFDDDLLVYQLDIGRNIVLYHHERWDGTGYPQKLVGEDIPIEARIVSVVDVFDALISARPYKEKWPVHRAINYIRAQSGMHFDPEIVISFLEIAEDLPN